MLVLCSTALQAQRIALSDSLKLVFKEAPKPTGAINTWSSFITGRPASIADVRLGVIWKKTLSLGLGYHWLYSDFSTTAEVKGKEVSGDVRFRYWGPYAQYTYYRKGPWELGVDLQLGVGRSFLRSQEGSVRTDYLSGRMIVYEASMSVSYKILNTFVVEGGYGYRVMLKSNRALNQQFTAPVYTFGVGLMFDEIYKWWKKQQGKEE